MISSKVGRRLLLALILLGFVSSFAVLAVVGRQGGVSEDTAIVVIKRLIEFHLPSIGVLAGFYFSERGSLATGSRSTTADPFVLAVFLVGTWVNLPPVLLAASDTVEGAMRLLDSMAVGSALVMGALAYYFAKSGKHS